MADDRNRSDDRNRRRTQGGYASDDAYERRSAASRQGSVRQPTRRVATSSSRYANQDSRGAQTRRATSGQDYDRRGRQYARGQDPYDDYDPYGYDDYDYDDYDYDERGHDHASVGVRDFKRTAEPHHSARNVRRRSPVPFILGALALVAIALVVVFVFIYPLRFDVVVNGATMTVNRGTTIEKLIENGAATPAPGDMLAVDGTVFQGGAGEAFSATVNGETVSDGTYQVDRDDVIDISDGADTTEPYSETQEVVPHGDNAAESDFASYFNGALHVYERGQDGLNVTRTGELSGKTVTEQVTPVIDAGFRIYTADVGSDMVCALTFDDGPWPQTTDEVLDLLEANGARATFFTIGNQVADNADAVRRAYEMGCEVCTHSWDHAAGSGGGVNLTYMSTQEQINEVTKGMDAITQATGAEAPRILRAPGGNFYGELVSTMEPYLDAEIGWEVDTEDWSKPGADAIYEAIMSVKPGQVVLMHDGGGDRSQTVEALARALPELRAQGYSFITISELLAYGHA